MFDLPQIVEKEELDTFHRNISNNVKEIRQKRKMSQIEVALSIGQRSSGFYANAENYAHGKHFNIEHIYKLSKLFEVDMHTLLK